MIEKLRQCNSCSGRARCEFFIPGKDCFIDSRTEVLLFGRNEGFSNLWMAYVNRTIRLFGGNLKNRKNRLIKKEKEYWEEIKPIYKRGGEECKILNNSESGKKQEN